MSSTPPNLPLLWRQYKPVIISLFLASGAYLFLRLINLTLLPIFADEAIYIRWAQVMRAEATLRFLPLSDGKQPLFMWLIIPFLKLISDPLLAGRLVSVCSGLGPMLGIFFLTLHVTKSQKIALLSSILSCIVPYIFFFDRLALADSLLTMCAVWAIYFALRLAHTPQLDLSLLTGGTIGAAWLTKSPAVFLLGLLPITGITFIPQIKSSPSQSTAVRRTTHHPEKQFTLLTPIRWHYTQLIFYWLISGTITFAIYNILRLGPEFHQIAIRNRDYIYPISEILSHPLQPFLVNFPNTLCFLWSLLTPPIILTALLGVSRLWANDRKTTIFLLTWILVPLLGQSVIARSVTARYFLFAIPPLLVFAAQGIFWLISLSKNNYWKLIITIIIFILPLRFDFLLLTRPELAPLPRIERAGYLEEWTAGTGLRDIAQYLQNQAASHSIVVGTEGFFGTMPDGLQIYFDKQPKVTIIGHQYEVSAISQDRKSVV